MRTRSYSSGSLLFSAILGVAACGSDTSDPGADGNTTTARATWYQDVGPIMATHCMSCHQAGGIAPFALTDYESARENGERCSADHVKLLDALLSRLLCPFATC